MLPLENDGRLLRQVSIKGEDVQDLMITAVEYCYELVDRLPQAIE